MMYVDKLYCFFIIGMTINEIESDPAGDQLYSYKNKTQCCPTWTTTAGRPIDYEETRTLNKNLVTSILFTESLLPFVRERSQERVVHAKGAGAFGYFIVTDDVTDICKADFLSEVGKRTKVAVRFSLTNGERGTPDTSVDGRGFAVKFYTEEGNFDLVGLGTETFLNKDPMDFVSQIRSMKKNPVTNFKDQTMTWDYVTLRNETLNTFLFFPIIIPDGYQHMPGFGVHTFQIENKQGDIHFVRFRMIPDKGIKNLTIDEASKISAEDPDYNSRKLYNAIAHSDFPSWTLSVQVFNMSDVVNDGSDIFDVTKRVSLERYSLRRVGRMVLNKNPFNYYAQVEQLAFNPFHLVPGIDGGLDSIFQSRGIAYNAAEAHRLGANFNQIAVNCPLRKALTYIRGRTPPVGDNMGEAPNYYPNSFNGPMPCKEKLMQELLPIYENPANNTEQARDFYLHGISEGERKMIIDSIVKSLNPVPNFILDRVLRSLEAIDPSLRSGVEKGLEDTDNKK